jgi:purine-cytosine permease-like protein
MTTFNALVLGFCVAGALSTKTMLHFVGYILGLESAIAGIIAIILIGEFARDWNRQRFYDEHQRRKPPTPPQP